MMDLKDDIGGACGDMEIDLSIVKNCSSKVLAFA
jgi:hypothetical protein